MRCSRSSSNREVYSNTILPPETRKMSSIQLNFTPKNNWEKKNKNPKVSKRKEIRSEQKQMKKKMKEAIVKMKKSKSWFFEKINKTEKSLARFTKEKREKNKINKIRNEKGEFKGQCRNKRIIRDYSEQLYANKMETWKKWIDS